VEILDGTQNTNSSVYYKGIYWNDDKTVQSRLNYLATGDTNKDWMQFLVERIKGANALILNCGNGWVERELFDKGVIRNAVGIDISPQLIEEANRKVGNRRIRYEVANINDLKVEEGAFDLILNHAALHHVGYLEYVIDQCRRGLKSGGILLSWDYIGPHRNQYPIELWEELYWLNNKLPENSRQDLIYPHLKTMLVTDPTEAIHSELILDILDFHFEHEFIRPLGGALAYPLLTHNQKFHALADKEKEKIATEILLADSNYTANNVRRSFFAFILSFPKSDLNENEILKRIEEEKRREKMASINGGLYYPPSFIEEIANEISDLRMFLSHKESELANLRQNVPLFEKVLRKILIFLKNKRND
jgi:SAM-dependent methyltransferase